MYTCWLDIQLYGYREGMALYCQLLLLNKSTQSVWLRTCIISQSL